MQIIRTKFPNAKICYLSSRIYAGYAVTTLNPEPFAYYTGWTVKRLIEDQINGDPALAFSGANVKAPWLAWGPYLWADGTIPRSDALTWICPDDYNADGTHPSISGRQKVAQLLFNFFSTDSTACPWFLNNCAVVSTVSASDEDHVVKVYPNPVGAELRFQPATTLSDAKIILYNLQGQEIITRERANGHQLSIDVSALAGGLYFISIDNKGKIYRGKFLKE